MSEAVTNPVVITLPREIDHANSEKICAQLCSAVDDGVPVVVDMTPTIWCDSSGFRMLLVVRDRAAETDVPLRLAVSPEGQVLRALGLMGFDRLLQIFPSLQEALAVG
jgi:anti-anti-sigma factor